MFSTTQLDMLEPLVQAYYLNGYKYYICHTNTNVSNYNNYDFYDVTFYFSKSPIIYNGNYSFSLSGDSLKVNYMTRNISNGTNDSKLPRETVNSFSGTLIINSYEHIMSNAENSIFMNTMSLTEYSNLNDLSFNLDVNDFFVPSVILAVILLFSWLKTWFGKNYRGEK